MRTRSDRSGAKVGHDAIVSWGRPRTSVRPVAGSQVQAEGTTGAHEVSPGRWLVNACADRLVELVIDSPCRSGRMSAAGSIRRQVNSLILSLVELGDLVAAVQRDGAIGLLQPASVDPVTRYRFYQTGQLGGLNRVIALKELGLTLQGRGVPDLRQPDRYALIDRALYLPQSWTGDPGRRATAGVPSDVEFATKPALAYQMITWALDGGAAARWVADDEVYGADPSLRARTGEPPHRVRAGRREQPPRRHRRRRPARRPDGYPPAHRTWQRISAGQGSNGLATTTGPGSLTTLLPRPPYSGRCSSDTTTSLASPPNSASRPPHRYPGRPGPRGGPPLDCGGIVAGRKGAGRTGPAPGPSLELLAPLGHADHAHLGLPGVLAAAERACQSPARRHDPADQQRDPPSAHLHRQPDPQHSHRGRWSAWRRVHQHRAWASHYQKRART
jgi:hypothetical protein